MYNLKLHRKQRMCCDFTEKKSIVIKKVKYFWLLGRKILQKPTKSFLLNLKVTYVLRLHFILDNNTCYVSMKAAANIILCYLFLYF